MRSQLWRRLFAAAVGTAVLMGSASAQAPAIPAVPAVPAVPQAPAVPTPPPAAQPLAATPAYAQPAPGPTAPSVAVPEGAPTPVVVGNGNTHTHRPVGPAIRGFAMQASGGYYGTNCLTSQTCNNGCGSLKSDLGFVFGSCRSFFHPCGPQGLCGSCGKCRTPVYGNGLGGPFNPCQYDSYLNH